MRSGIVVLAGLVAAGCATKSDVKTLQDTMLEEIREVQAEQERFRTDLGLAVDSLEAAQGRRQVREQSEFERRLNALEDRLAEVLELSAQNNQLLVDLLDQRVSTRSRTSDPGGPVASGGGPAGTPTGGGVPDQYYAAALNEYNRGNYGTARGAFEEFLLQYPSHELASDAQYYLAEAYEAEGDTTRALVEYQRVSEQFPDSERAPRALYKRGRIQAERGNVELARRLYRQIEAGYPQSPEAHLAAGELRKLGG